VNDPRIIVALDFAEPDAAVTMARQFDPGDCRLKVGKELFTRSGPVLLEQLMKLDFDVFLDLKFHDIPNTVASACVAAADLGVWMVNVHASGGRRMLEAARERLERCSHRPLLIGVTVLTSMDTPDLQEIGILCSPQEQVLRLARLSAEAGLDGVVCSAAETAQLRQDRGREFCLVTPGIRPVGSGRNDQVRVMTPTQAIENGSDYLVIGRPITQANDPRQALAEINAEIATVSPGQV